MVIGFDNGWVQISAKPLSKTMQILYQWWCMLTHWGCDKMAPHFADNILKCLFLNENIWILIKISLKFVPKGSVNNIPSLFQLMAWCRPGNKPLSEPMLAWVTDAYMLHSASMSWNKELLAQRWAKAIFSLSINIFNITVIMIMKKMS